MEYMSEVAYKEEHEKEHRKAADLASRVADLEGKCEELEWKLNRIKNNPLWKLTGPLRKCMHWAIRQRDRLRNLGGVKGFIHKVGYKKREHEAMKHYGTESFPSPEQAKRERETVFPRMVTFSILVPLYNTPKNFLTQMIDSVMNQTYENWQLCLADGSDPEHGFVGENCREYVAKANGTFV